MDKYSFQVLHRLGQARRRYTRTHGIRVGLVFVGVLAAGTIGYSILGWPAFDAFYMTLITITTIGYGEIRQLSPAGRVFTSVLIVVGVGNSAYALATLTHFFASGGWDHWWRTRRMKPRIERMSGHTIVCGFGRLGSAIGESLVEHSHGIVVIEKNVDIIRLFQEQNTIPYVEGDATDDSVLERAGIRRASTLVAALDDDAANVFLTLTARVLNPAITIYGKADDPKTLVKLNRAGANHSFSPSLVAGHRIALQIVRPGLMDLVEVATRRGQFEFAIEEVRVAEIPNAVGRSLAECHFWGRTDTMILAIRRGDGSLLFPPRGEVELLQDDCLIIMGKTELLRNQQA